LNRQERIARLREVDLYPVITESFCAGRTSLQVLDGVILGGAKIVQLREKEIPMKQLFELALAFRRRTADAGVLMIVDDHVDLALAVDADGVHLGQNDLPLSAARRIAPELLLGRSTHSLAQALEAQEQGADYANLGPIFSTGTKPEHTTFLGPDAIRQIAPHLRIPFTVMGGINGANIDQVVDAGAQRVAVVTAVTCAANVAEAVRELRRRIRRNA
jgi:thiamine-phosphate pyrophosphorylase